MNLKKNLIMETQVNTKQKLYNIYFDDHHKRPPTYLGTTNNLERWLKENNENRQEGFKETLDDFLIKECMCYLYDDK